MLQWQNKFSSAPGAVVKAQHLTKPSRGTSVCIKYLLGAENISPFKGHSFHVGWNVSPDAIDPEKIDLSKNADMQALKSLSVGRNVRKDGSQISGLQGCDHLLRVISSKILLQNMPSYLDHQRKLCTCTNGDNDCEWNVCDQLWNIMGGVNQFGGLVVRTKLLARKRPNLFPIYDAVVAERLGIGNGTMANYSIWGTFQEVMKDEVIIENLSQINRNLRQRSSSSEVTDLTLLRILDICLWMKSESL